MNIDVSEIQKITTSIFDAEHRCSENPMPGEFKILHCVTCEDMPQDTWQFHNFWLARQEAVDMGEASRVGEVISNNMFGIMFCPFCGIKLEQVAHNNSLQADVPDGPRPELKRWLGEDDG